VKRLNVFVKLTIMAGLTACGVASPAPTAVAPTVESGLAAAVPTSIAAGAPLGMSSSSDEIRLRMLMSHTYWNRLWLDATLTTVLPDPVAERQQLWVDQGTASFRLLSGPQEGKAERLTVANGAQIRIFDIRTGQAETQTQMPVAPGGFNPTAVVSSTIVPYPLAGQIGTRLASLVFSTELAQRGGSYVATSVETVAGRSAIVVDWSRQDGMRPSRYWVDVVTGVILRAEEFGKAGGEQIESEVLVQQVVYDEDFAPDLFDLEPATAPVFGDAFGNPLDANAQPPTAPLDDMLGFVYLTRPSGPGDTQLELMLLPASCLVGLTFCAEPEVVSTPFELPYIEAGGSIAWSPDGKLAAFAFPRGQPRPGASLYLFDVATGEWRLIAEFPQIDVPLFTSKGDWIAFRIQDESGVEQEYAVRVDGSGLRNLTASSALPEAERPYVVDGWIVDNVLLRSGRPGHEGSVYLVRASDGAVRSLFASQLTKAMFVPSPDGSLLAWTEFDTASQTNTLKVIAPDGSTYRELATFLGTLYPITWSPQITYLAFNVYGAPNTVGDEVYIIRRDGRDLRQVLRSEGVQRLLFSPDGMYLIVAAPGVDPFVAIDLTTNAVHVLRLGQKEPDHTWRLVGWAAP